MLPGELSNLPAASFQLQQEASSARQESQPRLKKDTTSKAALSNNNHRGDLQGDKHEEKQCILKKLVRSSQRRKATLL